MKNIKTFEDDFSVNEKWDGEGKVKSTGQFGKKTVEELKKSISVLKKKKDRSAAESKKLRQLNFAVRAKTGWGKVKEGEIQEKYDMDLEGGDIGDEYAKFVICQAFEEHKETGHMGASLRHALDELIKEEGEAVAEHKDLIIDSIVKLLESMAKEAKSMQ
jgi:hypothetical protein